MSGEPANPLFGHTRTRVARDHAVIAPDSHVPSPLVGWDFGDGNGDGAGEGIVLISPAMSGGGPRFVQYLVHGTAHTNGAAPGVQRLVYVLSGSVELDGLNKPADTAIWFPPGDDCEFRTFDDTELLVFEKPYEPRVCCETPDRVVTCLQVAPNEPFLGDPDAILSTLLPIEPAFDMAVNVFTFQPGAALPLVETHIMEHGLYMARGQGVYRLGD
ncbi:MAG: (S)-ureidoglycine aminohydrolase, partial [Planctomycetota bacterium]